MKAISSSEAQPNSSDGSLVTSKPDDIGQLKGLIGPFILFSMINNLVVLVSPLFMMQVLDRVVPSGNTNTLLLLLSVAIAALILNGFAEFGRDRSLGRISRWIDTTCTSPIFELPYDQQGEKFDALTKWRNFLSGPRPAALLSTIWLPIFAAALFFIHPAYLALLATIIVLIGVTRYLAQTLSSHVQSASQSLAQDEGDLTRQIAHFANSRVYQSAQRNILERLLAVQHLRTLCQDRLEGPEQLADAAIGVMRLASQILALSLGAYLVSQNQMSAGGMIAASIIAAKTLGTIEHSAASLKEFGSLRSTFQTLQEIDPREKSGIEIGGFDGNLSCVGLTFPRGGGSPPRLDRVGFELTAGECLAIIGDSGGGKTTLLNALAGMIPAPIGTVQLDGTDVRHLSARSMKHQIGFMPQLAHASFGTIAENICGFESNPNDAEIVAAARRARVHGLVSSLGDGYATDLSQEPHLLTAGQKQQLSLATALYHNPRYLFLDEPNALLDRHAERSLALTIEELKSSGTTILMVLHRAGIIGLADKVLLIQDGRVKDFGPRSQVLGRQSEGLRVIRLPLLVSSIQDLTEWISGQFSRNDDAPFAAKAVHLATELFYVALLNGSPREKRQMQIEFKFLDDNNIEIQMVERGSTGAEKLLPRIRAALKEGNFDHDRLEENARPLLAAARIASDLKISAEEDFSKFWARLTQKGPDQKGLPN